MTWRRKIIFYGLIKSVPAIQRANTSYICRIYIYVYSLKEGMLFSYITIEMIV